MYSNIAYIIVIIIISFTDSAPRWRSVGWRRVTARAPARLRAASPTRAKYRSPAPTNGPRIPITKLYGYACVIIFIKWNYRIGGICVYLHVHKYVVTCKSIKVCPDPFRLQRPTSHCTTTTLRSTGTRPRHLAGWPIPTTETWTLFFARKMYFQRTF